MISGTQFKTACLLALIAVLMVGCADGGPTVDSGPTSVDVATQYVADNEEKFTRAFSESILRSKYTPAHVSLGWLQLYIVGEPEWVYELKSGGVAGAEWVVVSVRATFVDDKARIDVVLSFDLFVDPDDKEVISVAVSKLNDIDSNYGHIDVLMAP